MPRFPMTERAVEDMATGTHEFDDDARNADVLISVNGELVQRADATVSVFDSGFVLGDGVWEGIRVHHGHPTFLEQHLARLYEGAKALIIDVGLTRDELTARIYETIDANGMHDGVHVRLMVTRRPQAHAVPGPAGHGRLGDSRRHR